MRGLKIKLIVRAAVVLLVALVTVCLWVGRSRPERGVSQAPVSRTNPPSESHSAASDGQRQLDELLQKTAAAFGGAADAGGRSELLEQLRRTLANGSTNEVAAAIRRFLDSKVDAPTGQGFKLSGGLLTEAPTLRTFLLDQLSRNDPAAAAAYARTILEQATSPDEWAVALRNLARGDSSADARALLQAKTGELLRNESWQRDSSVGYLEAFDTVVYLGGTDLLSPLSDLLRKQDNPAVAHAAFLAMDRLVINQPAEELALLEQHLDWMQGREETRANYFARADIGDATQRRLVENYLLDPARDAKELQVFAGVFPNANFMISQNLLTDNATLDRTTLRRRDQAALDTVTQWLADPRFESIKPSLLKISERLKEFTK